MFFFFFDTFSDRLKSAMCKQCIDTFALAAMIGVSVVTVKRWLNNTYKPRYANLAKIARVLCVSTDFLCIEE